MQRVWSFVHLRRFDYVYTCIHVCRGSFLTMYICVYVHIMCVRVMCIWVYVYICMPGESRDKCEILKIKNKMRTYYTFCKYTFPDRTSRRGERLMSRLDYSWHVFWFKLRYLITSDTSKLHVREFCNTSKFHVLEFWMWILPTSNTSKFTSSIPHPILASYLNIFNTSHLSSNSPGIHIYTYTLIHISHIHIHIYT